MRIWHSSLMHLASAFEPQLGMCHLMRIFIHPFVLMMVGSDEIKFLAAVPCTILPRT